MLAEHPTMFGRGKIDCRRRLSARPSIGGPRAWRRNARPPRHSRLTRLGASSLFTDRRPRRFCRRGRDCTTANPATLDFRACSRANLRRGSNGRESTTAIRLPRSRCAALRRGDGRGVKRENAKNEPSLRARLGDPACRGPHRFGRIVAGLFFARAKPKSADGRDRRGGFRFDERPAQCDERRSL